MFQTPFIKKLEKLAIFQAAALFLLTLAACAKETTTPGVFGLYVENDLFSGSDGGYSSGIKLVWDSPAVDGGSGKGRLPGWLDSLSRKFAFNRHAGSRRFVSLSFGHSICTPENVKLSRLIPDDRPYAGYVSVGLGFNSRGASCLNTLEFEAGLVGPHSFAGDVQRFLHRLFGWTYPRGWANQLEDEAVLGVYYDHKRRILETGRAGKRNGDLIIHAGGGLSNLFIGAGAGMEIRAGWNLPDNFGISLIRPGEDAAALSENRPAGFPASDHFSFHLFGLIEGQAVARDLFLDGNTFRHSHRVDRIPFRSEVATGFAVGWKSFRSSFCLVYQSKPFKTRKYDPFFGSLHLSFIF